MVKNNICKNVNTAEGLLHFLLCKNEQGVWFFESPSAVKFIPLPRWMWIHCERACPDPKILSKDS